MTKYHIRKGQKSLQNTTNSPLVGNSLSRVIPENGGGFIVGFLPRGEGVEQRVRGSRLPIWHIKNKHSNPEVHFKIPPQI